MRAYHEHLRVPASWWALGFVLIALLGAQLFAAELYAGSGWLLAAAGCVLFAGAVAALLVQSGRALVEISGGELRAGRARLPLERTGEVTALDEKQTKLLRGARADPRAFVMTRPYLKRAVYIEVTGTGPGGPYWLVGSRRPEELAAAIGQSRPVVRPGGLPVG